MTTYCARILADSVAANGSRLTTMLVTFPRIILAEMNTHRVFSRSSASSRAVPIDKVIASVEESPYIPDFTANRPGMTGEPLNAEDAANARTRYLIARDHAVLAARFLRDLGVHKQDVNRLLEPFLWHTAIISATDWSNFFALRLHADATPPMRRTAEAMRKAYGASTPCEVKPGEWHLPLVSKEEAAALGKNAVKVSVARCGRVSYAAFDKVKTIEEDIARADSFANEGHMGPLEHVATPGVPHVRYGNFTGWIQYRKTIPYEYDFSIILKAKADQ